MLQGPQEELSANHQTKRIVVGERHVTFVGVNIGQVLVDLKKFCAINVTRRVTWHEYAGLVPRVKQLEGLLEDNKPITNLKAASHNSPGPI